MMIHEIQLIQIHKRNLELLEKQKARLGEYIPVHIHNQIDGVKKEIETLETDMKRRLQRLLEKAATYGLNCPPEVSIEIEDIQGYFKETKTETKDKKLADIIREGIQAYLRKLCDSEESHKAWVSIKNMPPEEWSKVCNEIAKDIQELI